MSDLVPHDLSHLDRLEEALRQAERRAKKAAAALVDLWDARDAGAALPKRVEENARRRVARANDARSKAYYAWLDEWKRVGQPTAANIWT